MSERNGSGGTLWFLVGLGIGAAVGILFAPHSGEETRQILMSKAEEGRDFVKQRYSTWDSGIGQQIENGGVGFEQLEKYMLEKGDAAANVSGRQEMLENIINWYIR